VIKSFTKPPKPKEPKVETKPKKKWGRLQPQNRVDDRNPVRTLTCFDEVYKRICEGWPLTEVARFIQEVRTELTEMPRDSLYRSLMSFKATIPPAELVKYTLSSKHVAAEEVISEGIDELQEMEKLYRLQMERIQID
jgi:hypothetical protein